MDLEAGSDVRALVLRSYVHSELGDYDQAVVDAENAEQAAGRLGDDSARADAGTALFIAHYRQGDYSHRAVRGYHRDRSYGSPMQNQGLGRLFAYPENLVQQLGALQEIDASLLLKPDDAELHHRRGTIHQAMRWHAKAAEDFTRALELYGDEAPERIYLNLAETYLEMEEHEKVVRTLDKVDQPDSVRVSTLLAYSHLRLGRPEDAMRSINAVEYGIDAQFRGRSGREAWAENRYSWGDQLPRVFVPHFVLKGAVLATIGDYEEAVKYLNLLGCGGAPWEGTGSDEIPADASRHRREVLDNFWREGDFYQELTAVAQQELSELCGYPSEFMDDPEAGAWATAVLENLGDQLLYVGIASVQSLDPLVIEADEVGLHLFIAKRYGKEPSLALDALNAIERVTELDPGIADAHRVKAELYLSTLSATPRSLRDMRSQDLAERYEAAVAAWEAYETLANPEQEVAANHHFARGTALAELNRKDEALAAYQKAFELGYAEAAVQQAIVELNK